MNLKQAHQQVLAAHAALQAAKAAFEAACVDLALHCPEQPDMVATRGYCGGEPAPMYVERVTAVVHDAGRVDWVLSGKKMTAAGKPHKTATALATIRVEEVLAEVDAATKRELARERKEHQWVAAERCMTVVESLDLDIERGAARKLEADAADLRGVSFRAEREVRDLIDLGIENANDTLLIEKAISTSEWASILRGTIASQLASGDYHRHTVLFFGSRGIKA